MLLTLLKILLSYILTIFTLLFIVNFLILYFGATTQSIFACSSIIGLYIFACMISKLEYDYFMVNPVEIDLFKFIKVIFLPSIIFTIIMSIFFQILLKNTMF